MGNGAALFGHMGCCCGICICIGICCICIGGGGCIVCGGMGKGMPLLLAPAVGAPKFPGGGAIACGGFVGAIIL